ncbi:MAG: tyrosine-type recombinase/integrase [Faecalibacterium sp.]
MGTIRKRGDKWSYRVDLGAVNGKRMQKEKGGFATKKEAAAAMTLVENELLKTGEYIEAEQKITMQQLYEEFIEEEAPLTRKYTTIVRYKSLYRNQIEPEFASNYLYQITTERIQKFINYKVKEEKNKMSGHSEQGLSAAYVRSVYNFLLVLFALAKKKKYIKTNPMDDVTPPKDYRAYGKEIRYYTQPQIEWMDKRFQSTNLYTAYQLGLYLGVRVGECFALRFSDIDWDNKTIQVGCQLQFQDKVWSLVYPKTPNSLRSIKMNQKLIDYLKALQNKYAENKELFGAGWKGSNKVMDHRPEFYGKPAVLITVDDFINVKPNGEMYVTSSDKTLARICKKEAGFDFKFHYLRHTHATILASKGVNPRYVMERLGHGKIDVTLKYYTHITDEMHEQVAAIMDTVMGEQEQYDKTNVIKQGESLKEMAIVPGTEDDEVDDLEDEE